MSIPQYQYQHATHKDICKWVTTIANKLNLRDWRFEISTEDTPPDWAKKQKNGDKAGKAVITADYMIAYIWIPVGKHKENNWNAYQTTAHEMLHVYFEVYKDNEKQVLGLEGSLYRDTCRKLGKSIAKEL